MLLHKQRVVALVPALIGLVSCFLPWTGGDITGSDFHGNQFWWGWLTILLYTSAIILCLNGNRKAAFERGTVRIAMFIVSGFIIFETVALMVIMAVFPFGSAQYGLFVAMVMGILLLGLPPLVNDAGQFTKKSGKQLVNDFGENADTMENQVDRFSEKLSEGWNGKNEDNKS